MKLNWVTLRVNDLEKSVYFYTKLLHLSISARFGSDEHQIVMLGKTDEAKVELIYEPNMKIVNPGDGVSIGLEIDNLDQLIYTLEEDGYKIIGPISPNPMIKFYFTKDPDGYSVQLVEQKTE